MGTFCLLVQHIELDAEDDVTAVLCALMNGRMVSEPAMRLMLDRYADKLSVADLRRLSDRFPRDGPGDDLLRPYIARKLGLDTF